MTISQETALQVLAKLQQRPSLERLEPHLFKNGPRPKELIELIGDAGIGKTNVLMYLIKKCILPKEFMGRPFNGLEAEVIFINVGGSFCLLKLMDFLTGQVKDNLVQNGFKLDIALKDKIIQAALQRLTIFNIYESGTLFTTLQMLKHILCLNDKISLIVLDSISANYWQDTWLGKVRKIDSYIQDILASLHKAVGNFDVAVIYTRPKYFQSKFTSETSGVSSVLNLLKTNTVITLKETNDSIKLAEIVTPDYTDVIHYELSQEGIIWHSGNK